MEDNRLIAEFMGARNERGEFDLYSTASMVEVFEGIEADDPEAKHYFRPSEMKFKSDWNWMMSVVQRIEQEGFEVCISGIKCNIGRVLEMDDPIITWVCGDKSAKLSLVHTAVVEFIKWYNAQPKN